MKLAIEDMAPANREADRIGVRLVDGKVVVPEVLRDLYKKFAEGGWVAPIHDPELGGMGLPVPLGIILTEMFIAGCASFIFLPGLTVAAGHLLEVFGASWMREQIVPKLYRGEWTGTMCLTEPGAGTAVGDLTTSATPIDGNRYKITGSKIFISCGDHDLTENIVHLVLARIEGDPQGTKGISLFMVPKYRVDQQGKTSGQNDITVTALEHKMGIHASPTCALAFGENDACEGWLIGERAKGIVYMFQMMNEARLVTGVQGSALANASYQLALHYAKERVQGAKATARDEQADRVAIIEHPDVRRNLMLAKAYSEGIRALLVQTAVYAEHAANASDPELRGKSQDLLDLLTPVCKAYSTDIGFRVTELAMQVHGGYGYISEYGVEQNMRDVKIASLYEGTNGVQALDLLGRKMRLKGGGLFLAWLQDANERLAALAGHERLGDLVGAVDGAKNGLAEIVFELPARGKADPELLILGATPFLEMFGHVEVSLLLLDQAVIADRKLAALMAEKGVDEKSRTRFVIEHDEARFLDGKIKTARFFARTVLPHARALGAELKSTDRSALDIAL